MKHLFTSKKDLEKKAEEYFVFCKSEEKLPTKGGFAIFCGTYTQQINRLEKRPKFRGVMALVNAKIAEEWTQRLSKLNVTGIIFYLKNAFREDFDAPDYSRMTGNVTYTWRKPMAKGKQSGERKDKIT